LNDDIVDFEHFGRSAKIVSTMLKRFEVGDLGVVRVDVLL
jgi:hypothetical protein